MIVRIKKSIICLFTVIAAWAFVGCTDDEKIDISGRYYLYTAGEYSDAMIIDVYDGDNYSLYIKESGTTISGKIEVSGDTISLSMNVEGVYSDFATGTIREGVISIELFNAHAYFCMRGYTPPSAPADAQRGSYFLYENGVTTKEDFITLDDGEYVMSSAATSFSGVYTITGENIVFYRFGAIYMSGTLRNGVIRMEVQDQFLYFCQNGKTPDDFGE